MKNTVKKVEMMEYQRALLQLQKEVNDTVAWVYGIGANCIRVVEQPKLEPTDMEVKLEVICTGFKASYPEAIKEFGKAMEKVGELVENFKYNGYKKYYGEETLEYMKYQY